VYEAKAQTDLMFERLARRLLGASALVTTAIASHNVRSIAHAMASAEALGLTKHQLEFQLLYGMGDALQAAIVSMGYPVRIYTPVGELIPGMAYLVRRLLENTSNDSFLRQDFFQEQDPDRLLGPPVTVNQGMPPSSGGRFRVVRGDSPACGGDAPHASRCEATRVGQRGAAPCLPRRWVARLARRRQACLAGRQGNPEGFPSEG
jgi:hypothetical protein